MKKYEAFIFIVLLMIRLLLMASLLGSSLVYAQHPVAFATASDLAYIKASRVTTPLLNKSYVDIKRSVDVYLDKEVDVPFPKDPAGGYTHDRHKENYIILFHSGLLYNLTGDKRYAELSKKMFLKYAALNPILKKHPEATSSSPGRLFWQALNDANWLVYSGLGYDLIYNYLTSQERKTIEDGAFKPEVDFLTKDLESWFNLIHNHGVWACAGVGIVGIATNNKDYINKALYGTKGDSTSGFLAQMNGLFSPDGYYTEGPYYVRYAILPYYLFANALHGARPELKIFQHRDKILQKALKAALQQTNINGAFFPMNDAMKEKDFTTNELITAVDIAWNVYGKDSGLLAVANQQQRVVLHRGGASLAAALAADKNIPTLYPYTSVEYRDGAGGNEGGISLLRAGKGRELTTLVFKYPAHGLSHGHYDRLGFFLFDKGNEIFQDYGSVRFVGVEQKWGGRYLPENKSFAAQTIAHSTLVADETSHFNGKEVAAEKYHGEKLFSKVGAAPVQVVSAREVNAYPDVQLYRTLYLLQLPDRKEPLVVDLFKARSASEHLYDLPFQYKGQVIKASFNYQSFTEKQELLGKKNGYQFWWKEAEAVVKDSVAHFTFLNGNTFYSLSSWIEDSARIIFARSGANDPNFNLRREPSYIFRTSGRNKDFINVIEIHGKYDPVSEFSTSAYPSVEKIEVLVSNYAYTLVRIWIKGKELIIGQSNTDFSATSKHTIREGGVNVGWIGAVGVWYDGKELGRESK